MRDMRDIASRLFFLDEPLVELFLELPLLVPNKPRVFLLQEDIRIPADIYPHIFIEIQIKIY